jgi:lysyl-tRNA synthetase class 2
VAAAKVAVVCGRVVQVGPYGIVLDDGSAAGVFPVPEGPIGGQRGQSPEAGDFVALELPFSAWSAEPLRLHLLQRPGDAAPRPFPSADGEWYRLHQRGARRLQNLRARAAMLGELRRFFAARDFLEIEAPLRVPSPGLELHLDAFSAGDGFYLITSPEYQMKRLLCAGLSRIYSLGKVFRRGEAGPHHNPEFTLLEWYRAYEGWDAVATDVEELCARLAEAATGSMRVRYQGVSLDLTPPWPRLTVAEAMWQYAGVRMRGDESGEELARCLSEAGHQVPAKGAAGHRFEDLFFPVFLDHVEPHLGRPEVAEALAGDPPARPVVLYDWPRPLCALARSKPGAPEVVERFEAYAAGLELCNGFGELCDPAEQRRRFAQELAERRRLGLPEYPVDERFLRALDEGMPPAGGVALGVDRLAMLLLDAGEIAEVLPFTVAEL